MNSVVCLFFVFGAFTQALELHDGCTVLDGNYEVTDVFLKQTVANASTSSDMNVPFIDIIGADEKPPVQTFDGWEFNQSIYNTTTSKINWYFNAIWWESPYYLYPKSSINYNNDNDSSAYSADYYALECLNEISFTIQGDIDELFLRIYTQTQNDSNNWSSWYRSSFLVSSTRINTKSETYDDFTNITVVFPDDFEDIGRTKGDSLSNSAGYDDARLESILAVSIQTSSSDSDNDFIVSDFNIIYSCRYNYDDEVFETCPKYAEIRKFDLTVLTACDYLGNIDSFIGVS